MKTAISLLVLSTAFATGIVAQDEPKLPNPPEGYRWERFPAMNAGFLCPKDWHVKREEQKGTVAGFISKENIDKEGKLVTGLSVNFLRKVSEMIGKKPSETAVQLAGVSAAENKVLQPVNTRSQGRISSTTVRFESKDLVQHYLLVADDRDDTLHLIIFESPAKEWEANWKVGEPILQKVFLQFPE